MENWAYFQVSEREMLEIKKFGTPVQMPFGIVPPNGGVMLVHGEETFPAIFDYELKSARPLTKNNPIKGMKPKNKDLHLLYDHLQNPNVPIVMVDGLFGTGKTSTIMAHACQNFFDRGFKLVLSKPHVPVGRSHGHLPGDLKEKLDPEFESFYQYVERFTQFEADKLLFTEQIQLAPLEYIRGRDYPDSWIVVDESQNLTPDEAITIASRLADGDKSSINSKLVLLGDSSKWQRDVNKNRETGLGYLWRLLSDEGLVGRVEMKTPEHIQRGKVAKALARALIREGISS